jgi:transglutaminase-like putative cysteine protease
MALTVMALLTPSFSVRSLVEAARDLGMGEQNQNLARALGLESRPVTAAEDVFHLERRPGLPARLLIGSGPELSDQPVMNVTIEEPEALAGRLRYWRGATYDVYNGRGWQTRGTTTIVYDAGQEAGRMLEEQWLVRQEIEPLTDPGSLLYVAGTLRSVDRPFQAAWRARFKGTEIYTDLFAARAAGESTGIYRADSLVAMPHESALRSAGQTYSERITRNYLTLPEEVPDRVRALAQDLTATEVTPYDRALAIERYLRQFPYSLDLPAPPPDGEITDYFLFEIKEGYCDYFATSMVVLARAAGVPARLATGYVGGEYDEVDRRYTVTADLAHSWPEIYFPGYGWIPFEPTAGRAAIERPAAEQGQDEPESGEELEPILAARQRARWNLILRIMVLGVLLILTILAGWWLLEIWRLSLLSPGVAVITIYSQMWRSGRRLNLGDEPGATPNEFAILLKNRLLSEIRDKREGRGETDAGERIDWLTRLYTRCLYSPYEPGAGQRALAIKAWSRLRVRLLWVAISRRSMRLLARLRLSR